jgi:predicted nucleotidyltransferase
MEMLELEFKMNKEKVLNRDGTNMFHMEQKDYKLEIVNILILETAHLRSLAKKIGINHMMVIRKIRELLTLNVVDFFREGRNSNYFLRKSPEALFYVLMAENYKSLKILKQYPLLKDIFERIQKDKKIKLALLFGSYAKGLATKKSDIDIFIETNDLKLKEKYAKLDSKLSIKIGKLGLDNLSKEIRKNYVLIKGGEIYHEFFFN